MVSRSDDGNEYDYAWCWVLWETGELDKLDDGAKNKELLHGYRQS